MSAVARGVSPLDIVPFAAEHLDAAATLVATRHRRDRRRSPTLPARFETAAEVCPVLAEIASRTAGAGTVALAGGRVVGFMLGEPFSLNPNDPFASMVRPRAGLIPYAGHAVVAQRARDVYPALYAEITMRWLDQGIDTHYICIPDGSPSSLTIWYALGFGQYVTYAVRATNQFPAPSEPSTVEIRQAQPGDEPVLAAQVEAILHAFARPPASLPDLPQDAAPRLRQVITDVLATPDFPHWLAVREQVEIGMHLLADPTDHVPALLAPDQSFYLLGAYTVPSARGEGIGTALLAQSLRWARETGHDWCVLDYIPANLSGARFWERHGFVPIAHGLLRQLDERVLGARPRLAPATRDPITTS